VAAILVVPSTFFGFTSTIIRFGERFVMDSTFYLVRLLNGLTERKPTHGDKIKKQRVSIAVFIQHAYNIKLRSER